MPSIAKKPPSKARSGSDKGKASANSAKARSVAPVARPLRLEWIEAGSLAENPHNWRRHPEGQMSALREVIADQDIGWAGACLYNERTKRLIDGHARRKAVSPDTAIPVLVGSWSEEAEKKILLTLDPLAGMAEADPEMLRALMDSVSLDSEALAALSDGLDEQLKQADLMVRQAQQEVTEDEVPNASQVEKRCRPGDMWQLGEHFLMCGDCRNAEHVAHLLGDAKINVAVTSPPYASQREYDESSGFKPIPPDEYVEWWDDVQANVRKHLADDGSFFVNIKPHCEDGQRVLYVADMVLAMVRKWGWRFVDEFCWVRAGVPGGWNNRFKNGFEPVYHFSAAADIKFRPDAVSHETEHAFDYSPENGKSVSGSGLLGKEHAAGFRDGMARPSNVVEVGTGGGKVSGLHSAEFPVGLPSFFIKAFSDTGDVIFEPFCGSGTTLIAAEQLGRRCFGMEISAGYCDIILARWEKLTGGKAEYVG